MECAGQVRGENAALRSGRARCQRRCRDCASQRLSSAASLALKRRATSSRTTCSTMRGRLASSHWRITGSQHLADHLLERCAPGCAAGRHRGSACVARMPAWPRRASAVRRGGLRQRQPAAPPARPRPDRRGAPAAALRPPAPVRRRAPSATAPLRAAWLPAPPARSVRRPASSRQRLRGCDRRPQRCRPFGAGSPAPGRRRAARLPAAVARRAQRRWLRRSASAPNSGGSDARRSPARQLDRSSACRLAGVRARGAVLTPLQRVGIRCRPAPPQASREPDPRPSASLRSGMAGCGRGSASRRQQVRQSSSSAASVGRRRSGRRPAVGKHAPSPAAACCRRRRSGSARGCFELQRSCVGAVTPAALADRREDLLQALSPGSSGLLIPHLTLMPTRAPVLEGPLRAAADYSTGTASL